MRITMRMQRVVSKVAAKRVNSQPVQKFAQQTVDPLPKAGKQLHSMAQQLGLDLPEQPGDQALQVWGELGGRARETRPGRRLQCKRPGTESSPPSSRRSCSPRSC